MSRSEHETTDTHHAILIGVGVSVDRTIPLDADPDGLRNRSLKGAAADIDAVEEYLKPEAHVKITRLTATQSAEVADGGIPIENSLNLPTLENVGRVLEQVIDEGAKKQTKHVYIHFSGHGTRNPNDESLSLGLYHPGDRGVSYLHGQVLADALTSMVKHGMSVTLILDCCFSGSVKRCDQQSPGMIRFLEYDSDIDQQSEAGNISFPASSYNTRQGTLRVNRLLDPQGYAAITACGPYETASEMRFGSGSYRGALSYFLDCSLRLLRKAGTQITYQTLYRSLQARFHARCPQQTPMHYGNTNIVFFQGLLRGSHSPLVSVFERDGCLILNAGEVHGVSQGDEYGAYPFYAAENIRGSFPQDQRVTLKVLTVDNFESHLVAVDRTKETWFRGKLVWKAEPLTVLSSNKPRIRLMDSLSDSDRRRLNQDLIRHLFVDVCTDEDSGKTSIFNVSLGADGGFQIQDGTTNRILRLSALYTDKAESLTHLVNTLGHLTTFKFFEGIENQHPRHAFEKTFSLEVTGSELGADGRYHIPHGKSWDLKLTNNGKTPLYLTIFNLRPSWEVQNMLTEADGGEFFVINPGLFEELSTVMEVSEFLRKSGESISNDIIKLFITSRPVSFPTIILPELGASKMRCSIDQLSKILNNLTNEFVRDTEVSENGWATCNYLIKTTWTR
ncbi:hypothetical protein F52700_2388 [Fusarium sp. NRRL 52700]|nr:hypothetical protein F52700_2388 [Fusarium sp. NRRL 52700]